jgi:hypothetical protein
MARSLHPVMRDLQRLGQVAGVGAGEQIDQAEPGELLLHRGGGEAGVVEVAALRPGGGVGEEVALAAPGVGVELGLGDAAQPPPAGVVDGGTVLVEVAGELADRCRDRFEDAVLAEPGGEGGQPAGVEGLQAEELLGGAVVLRAGHRDGEHHRERGPVAQEVEGPGRHQAQRPAGPHQRRQGRGALRGAGGAGDAGRAGDSAIAELVEGVEPELTRQTLLCTAGHRILTDPETRRSACE